MMAGEHLPVLPQIHDHRTKRFSLSIESRIHHRQHRHKLKPDFCRRAHQQRKGVPMIMSKRHVDEAKLIIHNQPAVILQAITAGIFQKLTSCFCTHAQLIVWQLAIKCRHAGNSVRSPKALKRTFILLFIGQVSMFILMNRAVIFTVGTEQARRRCAQSLSQFF